VDFWKPEYVFIHSIQLAFKLIPVQLVFQTLLAFMALWDQLALLNLQASMVRPVCLAGLAQI